MEISKVIDCESCGAECQILYEENIDEEIEVCPFCGNYVHPEEEELDEDAIDTFPFL